LISDRTDVFTKQQVLGEKILSEEKELSDKALNSKDEQERDTIASIIALALKAKEEGKNLILGVESSWIPGYINDALVRNAYSRFLASIDSLDRILKKEYGINNVIVLEGARAQLACKIFKNIDPENDDFSNVVLLGDKNLLTHWEFKPLWKSDPKKRAYFGAIDLTELKSLESVTKTDLEYVSVNIFQMFRVLVDFCVGKKIDEVNFVKTENKSERYIEFIPDAVIVDYLALVEKIMAENSVLESL